MKPSIIKNRQSLSPDRSDALGGQLGAGGRNKIFFWLGIGLLLFSWSLVSYCLKQPILVPSPVATYRELARIVSGADFGRTIAVTVLRFVLGFGLTALLAMLLGAAAGLRWEAAALFSPFITLIKAIPTMAIILLAIIWLKSNAAPVLVVFLISFPVLYWSWKTGMEETDRKFLEMAAVFRVSFSRRLWEIYLPTTRPYVWAGVSSALGLGFKVCIGAEVLCQPRYGIGSAFQIEKANLNTAGVFAWAIICVALVGILDLAVKKLIAPRAKKSEKM